MQAARAALDGDGPAIVRFNVCPIVDDPLNAFRVLAIGLGGGQHVPDAAAPFDELADFALEVREQPVHFSVGFLRENVNRTGQRLERGDRCDEGCLRGEAGSGDRHLQVLFW